MENMSFDDFKQAVVDSIKDYLPERYEDGDVQITQVLKNNDTVLDGLTIKSDESNVSPTVYLNHYYEQYTEGKDFDSVVGDIADVYIENAIDQMVDVSAFMDYEKVKDSIVPRLINAENNQELLADKPHTIMEDLAVTYNIQFGESKEGNMSVTITNALMERFDVSTEELHKQALENMDHKMPAKVRSMNDTVTDILMKQAMDMFDGNVEEAKAFVQEQMPPDAGNMFVLSNESNLYGAVLVLNDKVMESVSEQVGGDYFILPSSVHELLVLKKEEGMELSEVESMVQEVNAIQLAPDEVLSDHVYEYDANAKELYRADKAEEHEQKVEQKREAKTEEKDQKRVSVKEKMSEMKDKALEVNKGRDKSYERKQEVALA